LEEFQINFNKEYKQYENNIQEKLALVHKEFDKYIQTHESQNKLARLLDQEITRINQQQTNSAIISPCQDLLDKTTDLMNAVNSFFFELINIQYFLLVIIRYIKNKNISYW